MKWFKRKRAGTDCACEWQHGKDVLVARQGRTVLKIPGPMIEPLKKALEGKG